MRHISNGIGMAVAVALLAGAGAAGAAGLPSGPLARCAVDAVMSGAGCMDKYEASVWRVPNPTTVNKFLVNRIRRGRATTADLAAGGATQIGAFSTDGYSPCADSGQNCADDIYALSLPGVMPSANITWFQAQAACTNAGKRLPSNAEWQAAVAGTPDPGPDDGANDCNTRRGAAVATGSRGACVSSGGAFDMVGNVDEYVADWVPPSTVCSSWTRGISPTEDAQCLAVVCRSGRGHSRPTVPVVRHHRLPLRPLIRAHRTPRRVRRTRTGSGPGIRRLSDGSTRASDRRAS